MEAQLRAVARAMLFEQRFEIVEQRFAPVRAHAVWSAVHLHLQQAKVEAHLELWRAVDPADLADVDRAGLVIPALEQGQDVLAETLRFGLPRFVLAGSFLTHLVTAPNTPARQTSTTCPPTARKL